MSKKLRCSILGAGVVGPATARRLLQYPDVCHITIADADQRRAEEAAELIDDRRVRATHLDLSAADDRDVMAALDGSDVVVSAIPAAYSPSLAPLALEVGAGFCDFGGVTRTSEQMVGDKNLRRRAESCGRSVMIDCGFAPGLSGQLTAALAHRHPHAQRIITYVGGLGQRARKESFYWQRTFSAKGLVELLTPALTLKKGVITYAAPCSEGTTMHFPELEKFSPRGDGMVETRITAGAGLTPKIMHARGLQDCWEETIRWNWDEFLAFIATVPEEERIRVLEERLPHTSPDFPDVAIMKVVAHDGSHQASYQLFVPYDADLEMSAMAKVTGYSAAVVAHLVAQRATRPGVRVPEEIDPDINQGLIRQLSDDLNITYSEN